MVAHLVQSLAVVVAMCAERTIDTDLGSIYLAVEDGAIVALRIGERVKCTVRGTAEDEAFLQRAINEVLSYIGGERRVFDLPIRADGTAFQQAVWQATLGVLYGSTATYAEIACAIGKPRAARAVGQALNKNPIHIMIPCHRIIGGGGALTGYAGGLACKRKLLQIERTGG